MPKTANPIELIPSILIGQGGTTKPIHPGLPRAGSSLSRQGIWLAQVEQILDLYRFFLHHPYPTLQSKIESQERVIHGDL